VIVGFEGLLDSVCIGANIFFLFDFIGVLNIVGDSGEFF
jgi:hypothetical protein